MNAWREQRERRERLVRLCRSGPALWGLGSAVALVWIGLEAIRAIHPGYAALQVRWLVIAAVFAAGVFVLPSRLIGRVSLGLMGVVVLLLVVLLLPGMPGWLVPVRNGARCWVDLGLMMFQPSEAAKPVCVLALAWYLRHRRDHRRWWGLCVPLAFVGLPVVLILLEPDLGTAVIFGPAVLAVLVAAGARARHLGVLGGLAGLVVGLSVAGVYFLPDSMQLLRPHQRQRIIAMISRVKGDGRHLDDIGYQQNKAMTLIGSGGLYGYGAERSATVVRFNRLPESHTDMIFAVVVNRWGLVGGLATVGLYASLVVSFLMMAGQAKDPFARLAIVGFAGVVFGQAVLNIGMNIGLLPITGVPLPLVSYGGSSLVMTFAMVGMVMSFAAQRPRALSWPSFEFDTLPSRRVTQ